MDLGGLLLYAKEKGVQRFDLTEQEKFYTINDVIVIKFSAIWIAYVVAVLSYCI